MKKEEIKIFIVEDNRFYAELIHSTLQKEGYKNIEKFVSGEDCFNAQTSLPDIVILDYKLENLNGIDILCQIKAHNAFTQVILLSGQESMNVVIESMKAGAFDYIDKTDPNAMVRLNVMIDKIMNEAIVSKKELAKDSLKNWFLIF